MDTSALIPFVAHLVGGSANRLIRLFSWRDRLTEAVAHLGVPHHVELDVAHMVHAVMRESGLTTAGLRFEFAPAMAQDAIPPHDHPPARALAVILHAPRRVGDLLDVVRRNRQLPSAVLDCVGLPRIDGYEELQYAYLSVPAVYAEHLDQLDKTWVAGKRIPLIPFDARPIGGTVQDLTRLAMWRGRFMQAFAGLQGTPQHVEIDDVHDRVRFWMPRRPGCVCNFSPADARDMIPEHVRPPPRAVFVLFHLPYHTRVLLAALRSIQVRTDLLDCFVLPPIPAFPNLSYGFLTVHDAFGDLAAGLDGMWIKGKRMRAFRIQDLTVFADHGRLMEEVQTMAKMVVADELGQHESGQHNGPPATE
ncbi:hypothetical protein GGF32_005030 [Allomyces javanicus]|nr:hypothetical protein GGF32_005030 [Allomyces javanicus]